MVLGHQCRLVATIMPPRGTGEDLQRPGHIENLCTVEGDDHDVLLAHGQSILSSSVGKVMAGIVNDVSVAALVIRTRPQGPWNHAEDRASTAVRRAIMECFPPGSQL